MSSTTNTYTEQQIIQGCIAGDRKYQELLYKQLSGKMYGDACATHRNLFKHKIFCKKDS